MRRHVTETAEAILGSAGLSGVKRLWFASGSDLVAFQEAAAKAKDTGATAPRIMTVTHEHVGLSVAMGESMIHGGPVAVAAHADLGLLSFGGAIHNAAQGGYPVLIISGYPPTSKTERTSPVFWHQQRADQGQIVRQYTKWDYKLTEHDNPGEVTARALQMASSPPAGPTYLAIPAEVGARSSEPDVELVSAGDLGIPKLGGGDEEQVRGIARALLNAERPLVVTDRLGQDPAAVAILDELAREFAIGVRATRHRMNLSDAHPAKESGIGIADADAILVLEHPVPWIPAQEQPHPGTFIAVAGADPLASRTPVYEFRAHERVTCSPQAFLMALREQLLRLRTEPQRQRHAERWSRFEKAHVNAAQARLQTQATALKNTIPDAAAIEGALTDVLEAGDILTWELAQTDDILRTECGTLFDKGGSSLGWAVAAATGARIVDRARPAVCVCGDGSYMFGVPQALLWTQQQYDAPVLTVIVNNRGYRTGTKTLIDRYPQGHAARTGELSGGMFAPPPDFAAQAEAAGAFGRKVLDARDLPAALHAARLAVERDRRPAVVDVWVRAHVSGEHPLLTEQATLT